MAAQPVPVPARGVTDAVTEMGASIQAFRGFRETVPAAPDPQRLPGDSVLLAGHAGRTFHARATLRAHVVTLTTQNTRLSVLSLRGQGKGALLASPVVRKIVEMAGDPLCEDDVPPEPVLVHVRHRPRPQESMAMVPQSLNGVVSVALLYLRTEELSRRCDLFVVQLNKKT